MVAPPAPTAVASGRPSPAAEVRWGGGSRVRAIACDNCGQEYIDYVRRIERAARHYCNRACHISARTGSRNPNWRGGEIKRTCVVCGVGFSVCKGGLKRPGNGKYCSPQCRHNALRVYADKKQMRAAGRRRRDYRKRATQAILGSHTEDEWERLKALAKYRCVKCRKKKRLTRDHIIPLSKGGDDTITNIQPLCHSCNCRKHDKVETLL